MNKNWKWIGAVSIYIASGTLITMLMLYFYHSNDFFRSLFEGGVEVATPAGEASMGASKALINAEFTAKLSFFILIFVILLQVFAFISASWVFFNLRQSTDNIIIRMKKLDNADLFLDLPLYFGLFGTVSSFIIMSFNPQISRLIAYSSTLIGIIFSVVLRITLQYPIKQRMIDATREDGSK
ncbi:MAG: hypothetical protein PHS31_10255 [Victivallaceae bacterium]|nr:hypothetical protein [Victivallaceae bacterium]